MIKILKKIYNYLIRKNPMESRDKVEAKRKELNDKEPTSVPGYIEPWIAIDGYFTLTAFSNDDGKPVFNPASGYPVKVFVNSVNGEMKMYPFKMFETHG